MRFRPGTETPIPWLHAFIGPGPGQDPVVRAHGIKGSPSLLLVGPGGGIVAKGREGRGEKLAGTLGRFLR